MKKILIYIDWFLPGSKAGGPVRSVANLIDFLDTKFQFYILTRNTDYCSTKPYIDIEANKWIDFSQNTKIYYADLKHTKYKYFKQLTAEIQPDRIYCTGIYSLYFSLLPLFLGRMTNIKTIVAPRGMMSQQSFSSKTLKKKAFYVLCRLLGWYKASIFHATSEQEIIDIKKTIRCKQIILATNLPRKHNLTSIDLRSKQSGELSLVSLTRISPEKNVLFALECLATCKGKITFHIFGTIYDQAYFELCKKYASTLPDSIKVKFYDAIETEKVIECLRKYHFMFSPTSGENFGHSIFESFVAETPVLISNRTPWLNLQNKGLGFDLAIENKQDFVNTLRKMVKMNEIDYKVYSKNCKAFANEFYAKIDLEKYELIFNA